MEVNSLFLITKAKLPARVLHQYSSREKKKKNMIFVMQRFKTFVSSSLFSLPGNGKDYKNEFLQN